MILGMLPMALAIGEGSEQNAPLGRRRHRRTFRGNRVMDAVRGACGLFNLQPHASSPRSRRDERITSDPQSQEPEEDFHIDFIRTGSQQTPIWPVTDDRAGLRQ